MRDPRDRHQIRLEQFVDTLADLTGVRIDPETTRIKTGLKMMADEDRLAEIRAIDETTKRRAERLEPLAGHADGILTIHHPSGDPEKDVKVRPLKMWDPREKGPG